MTWLSVVGVGVAGVPQGDRVQHKAQRPELVFLAFAVFLVKPPAFAVKDFPREAVTGLLHRGLGVDGPAVGVIDLIDHRQKMHRFGDSAVFGERLAQR